MLTTHAAQCQTPLSQAAALGRSVLSRSLLSIVPRTDRAGVWLIGEVDLTGAAALENTLDELVRRAGEVHLDLADLRFIDTHGVAVLVTAAARLAGAGTLVLHDPPRSLCQILDRFWPAAAGLRVDVS